MEGLQVEIERRIRLGSVMRATVRAEPGVVVELVHAVRRAGVREGVDGAVGVRMGGSGRVDGTARHLSTSGGDGECGGGDDAAVDSSDGGDETHGEEERQVSNS